MLDSGWVWVVVDGRAGLGVERAQEAGQVSLRAQVQLPLVRLRLLQARVRRERVMEVRVRASP